MSKFILEARKLVKFSTIGYKIVKDVDYVIRLVKYAMDLVIMNVFIVLKISICIRNNV